MPTADQTPPTLSSSTSGAISPGGDIVLVFSEAIAAGVGNIVISDGATQTYMAYDGTLKTRIVGATDTRTISVADGAQVTISGNTVTIKPLADLLPNHGYSVTMAAGVLQDLYGNNHAGIKDTLKLALTTTAAGTVSAAVGGAIAMVDSGDSASDHVTNVAAQTFSGTYSGTLAGGEFVEVSLDNGATWHTALASANTWQYSATIAAGGVLVARVSDASGNHSASQSQAYTYDAAAPAATITLERGTIAPGQSTTVYFQFGEAVSGLALSDFTVTGGVLSGLSGGGNYWTATLTPDSGAPGSGSIVLAADAVTDTAGNGGASASASFTYNNTPGVATIDSAITIVDSGTSGTDGITNVAAQTFGGTYTGTLASGEWVEVSLDGGTSWNQASVSGNAWSHSGAVAAGAPGYVYARTATAESHGTAQYRYYTLDQAAPTATVSFGNENLTPGQTAYAYFNFNEAVTGLTLDDITVAGGTLGALGGGGANWYALFTPTSGGAGAGTVTLAANAVMDRAGNASTAGASAAIGYNNVRPTATVDGAITLIDTGTSATDRVTNVAAQTFSGTYSGTLAAGERVEVSLDDGYTWNAATVTGSAWTYSAAITANSGYVYARTATASENSALQYKSYTLDQTVPTATVTLDNSALTPGQTTYVYFRFNEAVNGLTLDDITVTGGTLGTLNGGGSSWYAQLTPTLGAAGAGTITLAAGAVADTAGNSGAANAVAATFTYDNIRPSATVDSGITLIDTGASGTDRITNVSAQTFSGTYSGTLATGERVEVSLDDGHTWGAATVNGNAWTYSGAIAPGHASYVYARTGTDYGHSTAQYNYFTLDQTAPTATVTLDNTALTPGQTTYVYFTFSEAVTGLTLDDVTVTGATLGALNGGGTSWYATLTPTSGSAGAGSVTLAANAVTDTAGNSGTAGAASATFSYNNHRPTATVDSAITLTDSGSSGTDNITNAAAQTFGGTFSGTLATGERVEVSLDGGTSWNQATVSGNSWTYSGAVAANGAGYVSARTSTGYENSTVKTKSFTLDQTAPTATVTLNDGSLTPGQTTTVYFRFNEAVTDLALSDITVTGGTLSALSGSGSSWSATLTPDSGAAGAGTVTLAGGAVLDRAGNVSGAGAVGATFSYNNIRPTATVDSAIALTDTGSSASDAITNAGAQTFSGTYSGTLATGERVEVSLDGGTTWNQAAVTGNAWSYSGAIAAGHPGYIYARTATDYENSTRQSKSYTLDQFAPAAAITFSGSTVASGQSATVYFRFNEAVTGLELSDFTVTGGTLSNLTGSGANWQATLASRSDSGSIELAAAAVADTAGNANTASAATFSSTSTAVNTGATVNSAIALVDSGGSATDNITNVAAQTFSGTYSGTLAAGENVEVSLDGGTTWNQATVSGNAWTYSGAIAAGGPGYVYARTATATDDSTRVSKSFTLDQTGPTGTVTVDNAALTPGQTTYVYFRFNETVSGLTLDDISVTGGTLGALNGGGANWYALLTPTAGAAGTGTVTLAGNAAADTAGNGTSANAIGASFSYNNITPTASVDNAIAITDSGSSATDAITNATAQTISGTFTGTLADGEHVEVSIDGSHSWNIATVSGNTWSYSGTIAADNEDYVYARTATAYGHSTAQYKSYTLDLTAPTASVTFNDSTLTPGQTTYVSFHFNEAVTGFTLDDITVTGGTLGALSGSGSSWSALLTPTSGAAGAGTVTLAGGAVADKAGNSSGAGGVGAAFSYNNVRPTATVDSAIALTDTGSSASDAITNAGAQTFSGTYSGALASGERVEVSLDAGRSWNTATVSGNTWSYSGAVAAGGPGYVQARTATDQENSAAKTKYFTLDQTAPTVTVTLNDNALTPGQTTYVYFRFDETVTDLALSDITVTGGTLGALSGSGNTWYALLTPASGAAGSGSITLAGGAVKDTAGNSSAAGAVAATFSYDNIRPTATVDSAIALIDSGASGSDAITNVTAQTFSGTYTGTLASGEHVQVSLDGGTTWNQATVSGNSWSYSGAIATGHPGYVYARTATEYENSARQTKYYTLDRAAPNVDIDISDTTLTPGQNTYVYFRFSESVTDLSLSDITVTGGTLGALSGSGATWYALLTPDAGATGSGTVTVAGGAVTDRAGNGSGAAAVSASFSYNNIRPTATVDSAITLIDSGSSDTDTITNVSAQTIGGTFTGALAAGERVEVSVDGGTSWNAATVSGNSWTYNATVAAGSPSYLYARTATDSEESTTRTKYYTLDQTAPTASVTLGDYTLTSGQTASVYIQFNETVTGLTLADFTVTGGALGSLSGSGSSWYALLTPVAGSAGTGGIALAANAVLDRAGNASAASSTVAFSYGTMAGPPPAAAFAAPEDEVALVGQSGGTGLWMDNLALAVY
ncbi:Ig-like domain-containing protein [Pseudoduganella namucuonensis]|uniref:Ig-like domain-containing protein n=1 Tax=Pseudoduganella namucuonensis TaxID=1035707 RepID=A0A1I7ET98_9BURK|nr:Ig-like domain-containing protein [Pseudoduganella namucuonensis]SFU27133.1 Ig-like domain-containing protein [Pseudoduganella namucuonensis]